jgi:flagellar basal body-associated protein FliL
MRGTRGETAKKRRKHSMPIWAWILIILLVVFLLGGFGYSRRGR